MTGLAYALILKYAFWYDDKLSLPESAIIGFVLSSTDPVAIVEMLKELGSAIKFNTLLEGESLFNDGTALIAVDICVKYFIRKEEPLYYVVPALLYMLVGGVVMGYFIGFLFSNWIHCILKDNKLIVMITMFCTYGLFFFCETYFQVSGILAVVTFGLYLGSLGSVHLTHESDEFVKTVWNFTAFVLETLVFLFTGCYIGLRIKSGFNIIGYIDILKTLIFYPLMILVKYLMLLAFWPLLNWIGYKIPPLSLLMLSFGGLKGSIALAIALLVSLDQSFSEEFRELLLLYVVSMIILTVCVSGLTIEFIMRKTGFL